MCQNVVEMTEYSVVEELGVAEAKRRFSELIDRVQRGERFVVSRHGRPAMALVPPSQEVTAIRAAPQGLAAIAGSLADWEELEAVVDEIYAARRRARDRPVPGLE
jgi:prevent-host-death family protein